MDLVLSPSFRSALVNDAIEASDAKKKKMRLESGWRKEGVWVGSRNPAQASLDFSPSRYCCGVHYRTLFSVLNACNKLGLKSVQLVWDEEKSESSLRIWTIARSNFNVGCSTNCDKRTCKQATSRRYFILGLYVTSVLLPASISLVCSILCGEWQRCFIFSSVVE